jgi:flagellar biosynthesis protein FlhG
MNSAIDSSAAWTADQADGLRRLFARTGCVVLPLVSNPHVKASGVAVERLTAALALQGRKTLVVDAGETSPPPAEASVLELAPCIEHLSPTIAYLAARGLPRRFVDTRGSAARLLDELTRLVPDAQAVLLHASAADLVRLCTGRMLRPLVLSSDDPESVKHAYAGMKLLVQRSGWKSFDLLLLGPDRSERITSIASTLSDCADQFVGASMHDWASMDELASARQPPNAALRRLVAAHFEVEGHGLSVSRQPAARAVVAPREPRF